MSKLIPKWYKKWNKENPKHNTFGPAIITGLLGSIGVGVAVVAILFTWPYATDTMQTGPRGTGMEVTEFRSELAAPDPGISTFLASTSDPVAPTGAEQTAGASRENVPPGLEDLTVENYDRLLAAMREWTGIPNLFDDLDSYQTGIGYVMIAMTQNINENWDGHVNANKQVGVTCYTCHRGQPVPSDIWFKISPINTAAQGWSANQNRTTSQSSFTSLPSDALEKYLLDNEVIAVHDLESRVAGIPGKDDYPGIQHAERTYAFMNYISGSLGVNCTFCHNTRAFYDGSQVTPQWGTESLGIAMVQELNQEWLVPLEAQYPLERLGPIYADAPKAACKTCHKGYQQPLQGTNVIADWPELATSEAPDYGN